MRSPQKGVSVTWAFVICLRTRVWRKRGKNRDSIKVPWFKT